MRQRPVKAPPAGPDGKPGRPLGTSAAERLARQRGLQTLTRIPPWREGDTVRLTTEHASCNGSCLCGRVVTVRQLVARAPREGNAVWSVILVDGRCVPVSRVEGMVEENP
jgi:hypothetical protein